MKVISKRANGTTRVFTKNDEPSRTQTQFAERTDINNIMAKYRRTGIIDQINRKKGVYADISEVKDYQGSLETVMRAEKAFNALPAEVRNRFQNDPQQVINFVNDKKNKDEAIQLGFIKAPPVSPPVLNDDSNDEKSGKAKK